MVKGVVGKREGCVRDYLYGLKWLRELWGREKAV
jgi:hypothetical protein